MVGLTTDNHMVTDTAFDILALEALLLVPRYVATVNRPILRALTILQDMLTLELASVLRNLTSMPQRDDQRLHQIPRARLRTLPR